MSNYLFFTFVTLGLTAMAEALLALLWLKERRAFGRRVRLAFGVEPRELNTELVCEQLKKLAYQAGLLMLYQEVHTGQIDPDLLPTGTKVELEYAVFRGPLADRLNSLRQELRSATHYAARAGKTPYHLVDSNGEVRIETLPPYDQQALTGWSAAWARAETARRRETERRERLNRRLRNSR
ncbi:MAG: hypothetical protein HYW89_00320 [Candidatus Sungiibacteriota bacterium]|uniref:Uncharacterized protein n=1 Tax=Candidatus Sungiibacteriota bacterium TaxID=2750080 RepID=A0A7T5RJL3_9BACT|nr:MAG: hypothetical protein HYW89_00320 [Candidatus Sungbacteria bacterium]